MGEAGLFLGSASPTLVRVYSSTQTLNQSLRVRVSNVTVSRESRNVSDGASEIDEQEWDVRIQFTAAYGLKLL